jgi:phage repressor protein C with HTH and peptisase S24 domain
MTIVADRLRLAMADRKVDQPGLAEAVGCTQGAISQILTGSTLRSRFLPDIAQYLRVPLLWLKGEGPDQVPAVGELPTRTAEDFAEQLQLVPIQSIDLAYGLGGSFTDGPIETEIMHFPKAWVESITSTPPALLTLARGRGDSMIPTIHSGDMVIIDRSQRVIFEPDALWAYTVGEIGGIKRLKVKGDRVIIMSDNKIVPDDEVTVEEINIVGRIAFIGRLL